jgi:hypothetical protein
MKVRISKDIDDYLNDKNDINNLGHIR